MIVWGGKDLTTTYYNSGAQYDPSDSWTATTTTNAPDGRVNHSAVWTGSKMIVWGGDLGATPFFNTGGQYDPNGNSWTATPTAGAPTGHHTRPSGPERG